MPRPKKQKLAAEVKKEFQSPSTTLDRDRVQHLTQEIRTLTGDIWKLRKFLSFAKGELLGHDPWRQTGDPSGVIDQVTNHQCKVVVLGASGVGKSSVLNALLDEGNLLPSSGTGDACTAVPIEIHYNDDKNCPDVKAEIQYSNKEAWCAVIERAKIETSFDEDEYTDRSHGDLQRVKLVYPTLSEEEIAKMSIENIIATNDSKKLVGQCVVIQTNDRVSFYKVFKQDIGSLKRKDFAAWPLIDHVRLYVRHPLLENGLVLVDIPGLFETNQARVNNAVQYLQKCSVAIVMTHASRSNSDANREGLVSQALQQMQYDQRLDSVILVCTKTDEVKLDETLEEVHIPEVQSLETELKAAKREQNQFSKQLRTKLLELEEQLVVADHRGKDAGRWKRAQQKASKSDWDSFRAPSTRLPDGTFVKPEGSEQVWSKEDVDEKIERFKQEEKMASQRVITLRASNKLDEGRLLSMENDIAKKVLVMRQITFTTRNASMKDRQARMLLDAFQKYERISAKAAEDIVADADSTSEPTFSLGTIRDRVFCVSALAYNHLAGLVKYATKDAAETIRDEEPTATFVTNLEDTEVPALARHLNIVTLTKQADSLRKTQHKLQTVLGALKARLAPNIQERVLDAEAVAQATQDFEDQISQFLQEFGISSEADDSIKEVYKKQLARSISQKTSKAVGKAITRMEPFSKQPTIDGHVKALYAVEYKAAVHQNRAGYYVGSRTLNDGNLLVVNFNDTVAAAVKVVVHKSITDYLIVPDGGIKLALADVKRHLEDVLEQLHQNFRLQAGVSLYRVNLAEKQIQLHTANLQQTFSDTFQAISEAHVEAGNSIATNIKHQWKPAYARAYDTHGPGARTAMSDELSQALTNDNVISKSISELNGRIGLELDGLLEDLRIELIVTGKSIAAEYANSVGHRSQTVETTGDARLDKVRSQMIRLGYDGLEVPTPDIKVKGPVKIKTEGPSTDRIEAEMMFMADEMSGEESE